MGSHWWILAKASLGHMRLLVAGGDITGSIGVEKMVEYDSQSFLDHGQNDGQS